MNHLLYKMDLISVVFLTDGIGSIFIGRSMTLYMVTLLESELFGYKRVLLQASYLLFLFFFIVEVLILIFNQYLRSFEN